MTLSLPTSTTTKDVGINTSAISVQKKRQEHVKGVTSEEVDAVFIDQMQRTVCQLNEPRTLKGLLNDYHNFLFDLRGEEKVYKTSYIKTLISEEFKDQIIFHNRYQKNESTLVFSSCGEGSFLESALNSWGFSLEDLLHNLARQVNEDANLCQEALENFLTKFVGWLINPGTRNPDLSPEVYAIASLYNLYQSINPINEQDFKF